jgi:hypothetical protein
LLWCGAGSSGVSFAGGELSKECAFARSIARRRGGESSGGRGTLLNEEGARRAMLLLRRTSGWRAAVARHDKSMVAET